MTDNAALTSHVIMANHDRRVNACQPGGGDIGQSGRAMGA